MSWVSHWLGDRGIGRLVTPQGFFPLWRRLDKISSDDMENANMGIAFGGTAVGNLLGVILVALLMPALAAAVLGAIG